MKKRFCIRRYAAAVVVLALTLSVLGCPTEDKADRPNPNFLVGTWRNANAVFTIDDQLAFVCTLSSVTSPGGSETANDPGYIHGRLEVGGPLGPNSFRLRDMKVGGPNGELDYPDAGYTGGNTLLSDQVPVFNDISVTLTPNDSRSEFTFWSSNTAASLFFSAAGPFKKDGK